MRFSQGMISFMRCPVETSCISTIRLAFWDLSVMMVLAMVSESP